MLDELIRKLPAMPPRPVNALPGLAYGAYVPKSLVFLLLIFAGFFALMPILMVRSDPGSRLHAEGRMRQGHILSVEEDKQCSSHARRIAYSFLPDSGAETRGTSVVCADSPYYTAKAGDTIPVRYLP